MQDIAYMNITSQLLEHDTEADDNIHFNLNVTETFPVAELK